MDAQFTIKENEFEHSNQNREVSSDGRMNEHEMTPASHEVTKEEMRQMQYVALQQRLNHANSPRHQ
jgi:hypothetical protein